MYLILDLGNTNKKLAIFQDGRLLDLKLFPSISLKTVRDFIRNYPGIDHCILSSVVPFPVSIRNFLSKKFSFIELDENTPIPLKNKYTTPSTLGKDRLAAAVAANQKFPDSPVLSINAGSCITYDLINAKGEYLGGAISPGQDMRFKALHTFTGKLPLIQIKESECLVGKNTEASIISGVVNGTIAEIEGVAQLYLEKFPGLKIILSGGDLKYFDKRLKISIFAFPNIVIHGLCQILEFNVNKAK